MLHAVRADKERACWSEFPTAHFPFAALTTRQSALTKCGIQPGQVEEHRNRLAVFDGGLEAGFANGIDGAFVELETERPPTAISPGLPSAPITT